jgi:hypothetical protein
VSALFAVAYLRDRPVACHHRRVCRWLHARRVLLPSMPRSLNVNVAPGSRSVGLSLGCARPRPRPCIPAMEPGPQLAWGGIVTKGGGRPMQFRGGLGLACGAAVIAACWAGCSAAARVTQPSARMPQGGTASAREAALSAANQQCVRLSKELLVLKSSTNIDFNENKDVEVAENKDVVVVDVTFRCQ